MESYKRRQKLKSDEYIANLKAKISLNSTLARQIGEYTACLFSKDAQITPLDKLFPNLFNSEEDEEEKVKNDVVLYKARMEEFMIRHNSKIERKEEKMDIINADNIEVLTEEKVRINDVQNKVKKMTNNI